MFLCWDIFTQTAELSLTWPGITVAFVTAEIQKHPVNLELFSSQHFNKDDTVLIKDILLYDGTMRYCIGLVYRWFYSILFL